MYLSKEGYIRLQWNCLQLITVIIIIVGVTVVDDRYHHHHCHCQELHVENAKYWRVGL